MNFGNVEYFYLLWLIPVLIIFYLYAFKRKDRLIGLFCEKILIDRIIPDLSRGREWLKACLLILCVVFLIIALTRPRWGYRLEEFKRRGVDLIICVDLSTSMLAEDVKPSRIKRAKMEVEDLLKIIRGDRIGLVTFAGRSLLQCPVTLDYGAFKMFLDLLDSDFMPVQGTAIEDALMTAIRSFNFKDKTSKAIILITDGEDNLGDPLKAAREAKEKGIKIFTIGIGSKGGSLIPDPEVEGGFKKDKFGQLVMSTLDEDTLQNIALITEGKYVRSVTGDMDLEKIYTEGIKKELEDMEFKAKKLKRYEERYQLFLGFAILLLMVESFVSEKKKRTYM